MSEHERVPEAIRRIGQPICADRAPPAQLSADRLVIIRIQPYPALHPPALPCITTEPGTRHMQWIGDLGADACNNVIEERVWHLRNGRTPTAISRQRLPDRGIEFRFNDVAPVFLAVEEDALETYWKEAIARSPQLDALRFRCND